RAEPAGSALATGVRSCGWPPTGSSTHTTSTSPERVALLADELVERLDVWHVLDPAVVGDRDGEHAHAALPGVCDDGVVGGRVRRAAQHNAANHHRLRRVAVAIGVWIDHDQ